MNVFDVLAIVPYFVVLVVQQTEGNCEAEGNLRPRTT